ncbi:hypothetical protein AVEN_198232-1 [Araneus ventricosus]|uniref:Uncharacterized protein n=1 Tax=Araneus ventricosus TaxID=182803 RepID=A0A4Y2GI98_ARAVE|nr:hypothetical protein AVEN_198232-1 [Araneus ventricosus]
MDEKAEAFAECLLGDIFGCLVEAVNLNIEFSTEQAEERFVPDNFYCEIIVFSKVFVDKLMPDISQMPVLLCYSENFFRRFTNSVCLKLINNEDPEVGFLKVMAFLVLITSMSFVNGCYRSIDDIPTILHKLLKEHIKTKFYEEDRFDAISSQCTQLQEDEKWYDSTVEEMRSCMNDSLKAELAATETSHNPFQPDRTKIKILDVRSQAKHLTSDDTLCPYCCTNCIYFLKAFWKPKIVYKPECQQM